MDNKYEERLGTASMLPLILKMALPGFAAQLINLLYSIVDRVFIGHIELIGTDALAGIGVTSSIIILISAFSQIVGGGGAPLASIALGKGDRERAHRILGNGFSLLVLFTVVTSGITYIFMEPLLRLIGASDATIGYATDYLSVYLTGTLFVMFATGLNSFINAQGFGKTGMLTVVIGAVLNIILDPILIFGIGPFPRMEIKGAAIATNIGQLVCMTIYLLIFIFRPIQVKIQKKYATLNFELIKRLYAVGIPATLNLALPSLLISALNAILASFSGVYVLILGVYYKLQTFLYLPANGIIQGMRPVIGFNYGAREYNRVKKIYKIVLRMSAGIMLAGTLICFIIPDVLIGLFTTNPETIEAGKTALRIISIGFLVSSVSITSSGALEGLGKGVQSLIISLSRYIVVIIPAAFLLSRVLGAAGVWHAFWVSEAITTIVSLVIYTKTVKLN